MEQVWFKAKRFGWGWTPVCWQGWTVVIVYATAVASAAILLRGSKSTVANWIEYGFALIAATALLVMVCYKKGEKPGWRWGDRKSL